MSATLKLALGEMSARRRLLMQSLVERTGRRLTPRWELVPDAAEADVLLYDPAVGRPPAAARALPVVERAEQAPDAALSLCFPPTTAEFCAFLEAAARMVSGEAAALPAGLRELTGAAQALIAGERAAMTLEAEDGLRFGLTVENGAPRVHAEADERVAARLREPGFLQTLRLCPEGSVTGSGSLQQGQCFVWALARELAQQGHPLAGDTALLHLRRWPRPPESFIAQRDAMRICTRIAPRTATLRLLRQSEQFAASDAFTLVNAGILLGFVGAETAPARDPDPLPEAAAAGGGRYGALMQSLRTAFGLTARAH